MDNELDINLYNQYLKGDTKSFEILYLKYKDKLKYFITSIIKDNSKAEDIVQEVFIYIMQNKVSENGNFKYYIYLIAKSKAISYINQENKRAEINEKYLFQEADKIEKDVSEIIDQKEENEELLKQIENLDDKYKMPIYLTQIEELSYSQVSEILGISIQNLKSNIHRGKIQLRKNLIKGGFREMNKISKVLIILICTTIILSGVAYAVKQIREKGKAKITPTYTSSISTIDTNKVWVGTFNLVWNDLIDLIGKKIEFEDGNSELSDELNKQSFTVNELSEDSYYKIQGKSTTELKEKIEKQLKEKFNEQSNVLDDVLWDDPNSYILYAILKKEFNYLEKFPTLSSASFDGAEEKVKYFGLEASVPYTAKKNIDILFYNSKDDFAVKLKTQEGEEVYLYKTTGEGKSFEENYNEMMEKAENYTGDKTFQENDTIKIPYIKINDEINYDELCGKYIKGTDWYIRQAIQTVDFELNNYGGSVKSEALVEMLKNGIREGGREFSFDSDFILYLKEDDKNKPYFALKIDNTNVLVVDE